MIVAAARELAGTRVCFVGVGLPNIAVNLAKRTVSPDLELVYEAGVFGARPARLPLSIGDPTIVTGATAVTSMLELFGYYLQGGLIDVGFLGAAQIDRHGDINTTVIGAYDDAENAIARLRRRVRDCAEREVDLRDHASVAALVRRSARLPTSLGTRVNVVVTDLGIYHRRRRRAAARLTPSGHGLESSPRVNGLGAARRRTTGQDARAERATSCG